METTGRLRITYLLEGTALFGGVKVVLAQANALARRGHEVAIVSREPAPDWHPVEVPFHVDAGLAPRAVPPSDVVVATFWRTIPAAIAAAEASGAQAAHYCQGLEYTYTHNGAEHAAIVEQYHWPIPALCVSPHLVDELRTRFGRAARTVVQPLDERMRPDGRSAPGSPPRIVVVGPYEIDWKGVRTALDAVVRLRAEGFGCRLVRISQWRLTDEECAVVEPDEFHRHVDADEVARLLREGDLLLAPSWEQEGFGLPLLEAMASGLPAVASDIAAYRAFASGAARLVPAREAASFAAAARELLEDPAAWRRAREAGLAMATTFATDFTRSAEEAFGWIASGAWRRQV